LLREGGCSLPGRAPRLPSPPLGRWNPDGELGPAKPTVLCYA
jgi:hypothetical protein